jgi:hypothetical protein
MMASIFFMAFSFPADPPRTDAAARRLGRSKGREQANGANGTETAVALPMPAAARREIRLFSFCCTIGRWLCRTYSNSSA